MQEIPLFTNTGTSAGKVVFNAQLIVDDCIPLQVHYLLLHSI